MTIWDISVPVSEGLPVWPGDPPVRLERASTIARGDEANITHISACVHLGTHVDAPLHFVEGGASVEQLSLDTLVGPSLVVGFGPDVDAITPAHLEALALPSRTERLLLKTRNSVLWDDPTHPFSSEYVALTSEAATWLVGRGVRLVGIDYLSIQRFEDAEPLTHRVLLEAGVIIVEGLNLSQVEPGPYHLACLPLKLVGSDGAPARAVLYNGG